MHNACIFCHMSSYYLYTDSKERGEVVVSMPSHNGNSPFQKRGMTYVWNSKIHISQILKCWQKLSYYNDITPSCLIIKSNYRWSQVVQQWVTTLKYLVWLSCCLKCQRTCQLKGALLCHIGFGVSNKTGPQLLRHGRRGQKTKGYTQYSIFILYIYFVIWWIHIDLTVYHLYFLWSFWHIIIWALIPSYSYK